MRRHALAWMALAASVFLPAACNFGTAPGGTEGEGLTGILIVPGGAPAAQIKVRVFPDTTVSLTKGLKAAPARDSVLTNADGRFDFKSLVPGIRYNLSASLTRNDTVLSVFIENIVYAGGRQDLGRNPLTTSGGITLRVQSDDSAAAGATCDIAASPFQGTVNGDGLCVLAGLPAGVYQVRISAPGFLSVITDALTVVERRFVNGGTVDLFPVGTPEKPAGQYFAALSSTVALWTFNVYSATGSGNRFLDAGGTGLPLSGSVRLSLQASPNGSAAVFTGAGNVFSSASDSVFVPRNGTITLEARVRLSEYPAPSNTDAAALVAGVRDGIQLLIGSDGSLRLSGPRTETTASGTAAWMDDPVAYSAPGTVPLNQWVTLAVAAKPDTTGAGSFAYVNGVPVQLYRKGAPSRSIPKPASSWVTVGNSATANQSLKALVDEVRVSNALVLGPGLPLLVLPADTVSVDTLPVVSGSHHFAKTASTIALWTFDANSGGTFADSSGHGHSLPVPAAATLSASPYGNAVSFNGGISTSNDPSLILAGNDKITFEARIWMDAYPLASQYNRSAHLIGNYGGLSLYIADGGQMQAVAQIGTDPDWSWFGGETPVGTLPLGQWVDVAVAADKTNRMVYAYVNGVPIQLYNTLLAVGTSLRSYAETPFDLGSSSANPQPFNGKIDEVRISNSLVLGTGPDIFVGPNMVYDANLSTPAVPVPVTPQDGDTINSVATLSWNRVSGTGVYHLQIARDAGFASLMFNDSLVTGTSLSLVPPASGNYYWRLRARNSMGTSAFCAGRRFFSKGSGIGTDTTIAPLAYWSFEDSTGSQILDRTGNGHDGVITGTASSIRDGAFGKALSFDGNTQVEVPASSAFKNIRGKFSVSVWMRQTSQTTDYPLLEFENPDSNYAGLHLWANALSGGAISPGAAYAHLRSPLATSSTTPFYLSTAASTLPLGQWNHIVLTFDSLQSTAKIYVNGALSTTKTQAEFLNPSMAGRLLMGWRPSNSKDYEANRHYTGDLDEVRIYGAALTAAQIQNLYSARMSVLAKTPSPGP